MEGGFPGIVADRRPFCTRPEIFMFLWIISEGIRLRVLFKIIKKVMQSCSHAVMQSGSRAGKIEIGRRPYGILEYSYGQIHRSEAIRYCKRHVKKRPYRMPSRQWKRLIVMSIIFTIPFALQTKESDAKTRHYHFPSRPKCASLLHHKLPKPPYLTLCNVHRIHPGPWRTLPAPGNEFIH